MNPGPLLWLALATLGLGASLTRAGSAAIFTKQTQNTGNTFTTAGSFATDTPTATATATASVTDTPTPTPSPTATAAATDTPTPTPSATATPTATATDSPTPAPSATATATATATDSPTPTATPTPACVAGDTGLLNPSAQAADTGGNGDGFEVTPTYAFADDTFYALNVNGPGDRHRYYNYSISIPSGCSIKAIEVRLDWRLDSTAGTSSMSVELSWDGDASWTAAKTDTVESDTEHTTVLGSSTDTWGRSWTAEDLSDANFRVRLTSNSDQSSTDFYLDWVPVRVYYGP